MSKIIKILIIIFGIICVGVLIWHLSLKSAQDSLPPTQSPNEITSWRTYKNEEYGFKIKYPPNWVVGEKPGFPIIISNNCEFKSGELCQNIYIYMGSLKDDLDYTPFFIINPNDKILNEKFVTIDKNKLIKQFDYFQANYGLKGKWMHVVVVHHGSIKYTITYEETQKDEIINNRSPNWKKIDLFNKILSTLTLY